MTCVRKGMRQVSKVLRRARGGHVAHSGEKNSPCEPPKIIPPLRTTHCFTLEVFFLKKKKKSLKIDAFALLSLPLTLSPFL